MTAATDTGALFAVHGLLDRMVRDAAVVPVGQSFVFSEVWDHFVGTPGPPERWSELGWGRLARNDQEIYALSVGGWVADPYDQILDRLAAVIDHVSANQTGRQPCRGFGTRPLVAVPIIGIGRGGYAADRGGAVRQLVDRSARLCAEHNVDIVLVTPEPSVYAAVQHARRTRAQALPGRLEEVALQLASGARQGDLALLLGAGVGVPAGLPTWHQLISDLAAEAGMAGLDLAGMNLTATDQAELIQRRGSQDLQRDGSHDFQKKVAARIAPHATYSLLHGLLASLDIREVVTTNYDLLYENAVVATGRGIASVMPWGSAYGADRWILKLHGDVSRPESIVLTRRHMVVYDSVNRPSGALLQSLLLTRHLLMVGVSMTDDNVIRLAHEVQEYRDGHKMTGQGPFGTVLDVAGDPIRSELWTGQLDWIRLPEESGVPGTRAIELLLDRIALLASSDSSWVLDPRFAGLLSPDDHAMAQAARDLHRRLSANSEPMWQPLLDRLGGMGAGVE
jgi:hypothetical protein